MSSPSRAADYYERAARAWPGDAKEAWNWARIALRFDHGSAPAQALVETIEAHCRGEGRDRPGCDYVRRGAEKYEQQKTLLDP